MCSLFELLTNIENPHITKSLYIHACVHQQLVANGNRCVALPGARDRTFNVGAFPLKGSSLQKLQSEHIIQVPEINACCILVTKVPH